jgi:hypothetical protein
MSAEGERPAALVSDQIAATSAHQTAATGDRYLDWHPPLAQTSDLRILPSAGHEKNDGDYG